MWHVQIQLGDVVDMLGRKLTVFRSQVFAQFAVEVGRIEQLHFAFAVGGFVVGQHPDIGGDAGVVKQVVG